MTDQKEEIGKIQQELYELRLNGREQYLEFIGVDVKKLRSLEKGIDKKYEELAAKVKNMLEDEGKEIAETHQSSHKRSKKVFRRNIEKMIDGPQAIASLSIKDLKDLVPKKFAAICWYYPFPASCFGESDTVTINPPAGCGASGSVTYNGTNCEAHPIADSGPGQGTGTSNSALVKTSFRFAFTPTNDGLYCIRPIVQMNGHYLLWTWGTCGGTPEDLGSGTVRVTLRIRVDQLSVPVKQQEHQVFEQSVSGGGDTASGFGYDSEADGGASTHAFLEGGHEVVVWVECESYAQIANHGRAWVDMQTSPYFYFTAKELYWGPLTLIPIWP